MCNKISFNSKIEANKYIKISKQKKKGRPFKSAIAYYCESCDNWHLTSQTKSEQRRAKKQHNAKVKKLNEIDLAWQQHKEEQNNA